MPKPWHEYLISEEKKKNICAYLIQRYLGRFFEEKLTGDQLSLDLCNGRGSVEKISLDVQVLNDMSDKQNWPLEFVDGYIEKLQIGIHWSTFLKEPSYVEVDGLKLTLQPKQQNQYAASMFESMWNSMSSSYKLAEDFVRHESKSSEEAPYEGLELFAKMIDSVLINVKVKFVNTVIRLEHIPQNSRIGVGIVVNIDLLEYCDEAGSDQNKDEEPEQEVDKTKKTYVVQTFTTKNLNIDGIRISTVEFPSKARTFSRSMMNDDISQESERGDLHSSRSALDNLAELRKIPSEPSSLGNLNDERQNCEILFAALTNKQVVKIYMKQSEDVTAPKVSIEVNLSHLVLFLSPRQVRMLSELASGLASPTMEDHSNVPQKSRCREKPMTALDYQRVENELQQQMLPTDLHTAGLQAVHSWSGAPLEESDTEDNFFPLRNSSSEMYDSAMSGYTGSLESSLSSSAPSTIFTEHSGATRKRNRGSRFDFDPTAEISHFRFQVASLGLILLHEDLLNLSPDEMTLIPSSVIQMQQTAKNFFNGLENIDSLYSGENNLEMVSALLNNCCHLNHISMFAVPIHVEAKEKSTLTSFSVTGNIDASKFLILECLSESSSDEFEIIPLLKFEENTTLKPACHVNFKHTAKITRSSRKNDSSKTDINVNLGKCSVELDITMMDRISALLYSPPVCVIELNGKSSNPWNSDIPTFEIKNKEFSRDIKIVSSCIDLKLRFPIPDFRPSHNLDRTPWWKRHVRPDHLILKCHNATFETSSNSSQNHSEYSFKFHGGDLFYKETDRDVPILVAVVGSDEEYHDSMHSRIKITIFPITKQMDLEQSEDIMTQSMFSPSFLMKADSGPFTSKRVVHESNTPHNKLPDEEEELLIPGGKEEMEHFMTTTSESTRTSIDVKIPSIKLQLLSKHYYELIYNRINNDLLLWETNAPKTKPKSSQYYDTFQDAMPENEEIFSACRSGVQYESDSDSDDISEREGAILFYSTYDNPKPATLQTPVPHQLVKQSNLILKIHITSGTLSCNTPVRDSTASKVVPGQVGDFLLLAENATIFLVSGYKGDPELGYLCLQVGEVGLYHCEMIASPSSKIQFPRDKKIGQHLHPTIYKSERGTLSDVQKDNNIRDMLTVACKIESKHETHHAKTIRIAAGLNQATLRHRMCIEPNTWISQILDFFNVTDYPIPGYNAKEVLTELHVHMWNCAIDYRPLYLPLRSVITLGCFSVSSHLCEKSNSSTLRFIAEECDLFISDRAPPRNGIPSQSPVDIRKDYINVISLGLFELSLRTTDKNSKMHPHIDMRASNDCVHIYTCSDTGRALTQLITYIATDGDLKSNENTVNTDSAYSSPRHAADQELISVEVQDISKLTISQHQQVNQLLCEAIDEPEIKTENEYVISDEENQGARLFFFPDENQILSNEVIYNPFPQVVKELGDITIHKDNDSDDDFYFVGEETGLGLFPKNGIPEIKWLTTEPVRLIENHFFLPVTKKDVLKTPDDFPVPKYKYTLCEMNIIWHMFGGCDFKSTLRKKKERGEKVKVYNTKIDDSVSYSNKGSVHFIEHSSATKQERHRKVSWKVKGGVNRDQKVLMELELNKVKFQHEIYPESTFHASRQVLLVTELEIRDVLENSEFNKFLYQYTCTAKPKQSQGHMITVKAVHIRPDKNLAAEECCLRLSILPLRFNIDQDSLKFLFHFFSELGQDPNEEHDMTYSTSKNSTPTHQPPIMTVNIEDEKKQEITKDRLIDDDLILLDPCHMEEKPGSPENIPMTASGNHPIFFRSVVFGPDVQIKIDYQGKHVEVADGSLVSLLIGLVMGLGQLNCSELRLKRISYRSGLLGFGRLVSFLLQEWLNDIKKTQLPNLLSGLGPMYSFVQLFQGIKDLFWMPIEQYQKDGRIVRGIQRGANSFTTSTAMAALELTSRLIHLIQLTAETAYDMLSPGPSVRRIVKAKGRKKRYNQPQDIREGVANAYWLVRQGIGETAETMMQVASQEHEQKGYSGAVGGVLRQIPPTILKPIIIASEATSNVLGGMKYQLIPEARNEANQKWRTKDEE